MISRIVFHGRVSQGDIILVSSYLYKPAIIKTLLYTSFPNILCFFYDSMKNEEGS